MTVSAARWRLLALVPAALVAIQAVHQMQLGTPGRLWWLCTVSALLLALGLASGQVVAMRIASLNLAWGLPHWLYECWRDGGTTWPSAALHLGGLALACVVLRRLRAAQATWWQSWFTYLLVQALSRPLTDPALNVNLAHAPHAGTSADYGGYWSYWVALSAAATLSFWTVNRLLLLAFPPRRPAGAVAPGAASGPPTPA